MNWRTAQPREAAVTTASVRISERPGFLLSCPLSDGCCNSLLTSSKKLAGSRPAQAPLIVENQWCLSRRPSFLNERQVSSGRHDWIAYGCRCGKRDLSESAGRRVRGWDSLQGHSVDRIASWNSAAVESSTKCITRR